MKISDPIYGEEEINEKVLVDLINSRAVQRLKGISQLGMPDKYYGQKGFSRYEHSVGVLILLRKLGAGLREQIAGLLHDVSHTAFSHVVDWVVGDPTKEDYQDNIHLEMVEKSDIPGILNKYGLDYKEVSLIEDFLLLEREAPSLCADRIDYTLRQIDEIERVREIVSDLFNFNGQITFRNFEIAKFFAENYVKLQREHWGGLDARARYYILSEILREAIERKIICFEDLFKTDEEVINSLIKSGEKDILEGLSLLEGGFIVRDSIEGVELKKKFRYVDPEILSEGLIKTLSELSLNYREVLDKEKVDSKKLTYFLILKK